MAAEPYLLSQSRFRHVRREQTETHTSEATELEPRGYRLLDTVHLTLQRLTVARSS